MNTLITNTGAYAHSTHAHNTHTHFRLSKQFWNWKHCQYDNRSFGKNYKLGTALGAQNAMVSSFTKKDSFTKKVNRKRRGDSMKSTSDTYNWENVKTIL